MTDHVGAPDGDFIAMLVEYLPGQRWFSAKGQSLGPDAFRILNRTVIARDFNDADVEQVLLKVATATGRHLYQLWVGWTWHVPDRVAHAVIGAADGRTAYDALARHRRHRAAADLVVHGRDFGPGVRAISEAGRRCRHRVVRAW